MAVYCGCILSVLILVLAIHIYLVTRPKAPDANTRIMARIDIKKDITSLEAAQITAWMYQQKGIDHVLCSPESAILVFTYSPLMINADKLTENFSTNFHLPVNRILATKEDMKNGCPVSTNSIGYKALSFVKKII